MRTTLTLEDDVAAKLKAEVRRTGRSFKQTVNELLRKSFTATREKAERRFQVTGRLLEPRPGLSFDNIGSLLEQLEGPFHS